jgi:signal transduction histidine kinase
MRLRRQKTEYEKLLAIQQERQRISSEIHDDIGAGLSGIRLLSELTKQKMPDQEMKGEVAKIHDSISELSGKMREVIWSLNTDNDDLESLLDYIYRQAQQLFEHSATQLYITRLHPVPQVLLEGEARRHIYLLVKEALHNCIKHAEASHCWLTVSMEADQLLLQIRDNGKGMPTGNTGTGNGLRNMQKRAQAVNGSFFIANEEGTSIHFTIPLKQKQWVTP